MLNTKLLGGTASKPPEFVEDVFSTYLWTGNNSSQTITNNIDLAGKGGLIWIKARNSNAYPHQLFDSNRGFTNTNGNVLNTEYDSAGNGYEGSMNGVSSTGFSLTSGNTNASGVPYASWTFREQAKFFDVVTYTGNGVNGRAIPHNLSSVPGMVIVKRISGAGSDWFVWHRSAPANQGGQLNSTNQFFSAANIANSAPDATNFYVKSPGVDSQGSNGSGDTYIMYLFAHNAGGFGAAGTDNVISCGTFTTNGSGIATVSLGYEPQYVMFKRTDSTGNWFVVDNMRNWNMTTDAVLYANLSNAESNTDIGNPTATGFYVEAAASASYIYMAIRRPMKPPTSGTQVFQPVSRAGTQATAIIPTGFVTDLSIIKNKDSGWQYNWSDRLGGALYLNSASTAAEQPFDIAFDEQNGIRLITNGNSANASGQFYANWNFRRATGFFDEVCYTGNGTALAVNHSLGVAPQIIIAKRRNSTSNWAVTVGGNIGYNLNTTTQAAFAGGGLNVAGATSTTFQADYLQDFAGNSFNISGAAYVAYLFASVAGVSKVGEYTGNGSSQTINCGFTAGARFVMVKATSTTGDWVVVDTARGLVSGNDPFLQLNSTAAEVTGEDILDPANSGFIVNSTTENINASGASYIFLAVA